MEFGISTYGWSQTPLDPALLEQIRSAGFRNIELFANRPHFDYHDRGIQKNITGWILGNDVASPGLHLPFYERTGKKSGRWISAVAEDSSDRGFALDEIKRALELTDRVEISQLIVHLGIPHQTFNPVVFEYAYTLLATISAFTDVPVVIETLDNDISTSERLREFLRVSQLDDVGICYDIGHSNFHDRLQGFDRVEAVHFNDNHGDADEHFLPFEGRIDWPEFIDQIVTEGYTGSMVVEANTMDLDQVQRSVERLNNMIEKARSSIEEFRNEYTLFPAGSESE